MKIRLYTILLLKFKKYILFPTVSGPGIFPVIPDFMQTSDLPKGSDNANIYPTNTIRGCDNADEHKQDTPFAIAAVHPACCPDNTINISFILPVNATNRSLLRTDPAGTSFPVKHGMKFPSMNDLKYFKVIPHDLEPTSHIFS